MSSEKKTILAKLRGLGYMQIGTEYNRVANSHARRWHAWASRSIDTARAFDRCEIHALRKLLKQAQEART